MHMNRACWSSALAGRAHVSLRCWARPAVMSSLDCRCPLCAAAGAPTGPDRGCVGDQPSRFQVEPWCLRTTEARPGRAGPDRVAVRAVQRPHRLARQPRRGRAARLARAPTSTAFYELRPLPYAEAGYGYPESGQTIINVTNGKLIRLLVDDEPFDVRYGELRRARARASTSAPDCCTGAGRLGLAGRPRGAGHLDPAGVVHPARGRRDLLRGRGRRRPARVVVQSELVANEELPARQPTTRGRRRARGTLP